MIAKKSKTDIVQLVEDIKSGRKIVIPSFELSQAHALRALLDEIAKRAQEGISVDGLRGELGAILGLDEFDGVRIVTSGSHHFSNEFVIAAGNAQVFMTGTGVVLAVGEATVIARDRVSCFGTDNSRIRLYDYSVAQLSGQARVYSYDHSSGIAEDSVRGTARNRSEWKLFGSAQFDAFDNTFAYIRGGSSIRAYGSCKLIGRERVRAKLFDKANGWFTDESVVELHGSSIVYAQPSAHTHILGADARLFPMKTLAAAWK